MNSYICKYKKDVEPYLKKIDLFLKTNSSPFVLEDVAKILDISNTEVKKIIENNNIDILNQKAFFTIMQNGSSNICLIFSRILKMGIPQIYSPNDISYIYNIDINSVLKACKEINSFLFEEEDLIKLFERIKI